MRVTLQIHQARQRHGLDPVSFFFQCLVLVCFDRHLGGVLSVVSWDVLPSIAPCAAGSPERQGVLLRALALYLERMRWSTVSNIGPFVAGLCAFVLSFWSVVAFFYNVEILQAFFFLFVPLGPSLILRWRLARRLAKEIPDFEAVFRQIRTIRYWTLLSSFLTILMSTFWGVRVILREYSVF